MEFIYFISHLFFIFKIVFICLLLILNMYLVFSHTKDITPNKELQSGFNNKKLLSFLSYLGVGTAYLSALITVKNELKEIKLGNLKHLMEEERNNISNSINKGKEEHQKLLSSIESNREDLLMLYRERTRIMAHNDRLLTIHNSIKDNVNTFEKKSLDNNTSLSELGVIDQLILQDAKKFGNELTDLLNNLIPNSITPSNPASHTSASSSTSTSSSTSASSSSDNSTVINTDVKEASILSLPFDLKTLMLEFETLSGLQKIAVAMLLGKSVILSAVVSIIFIFYGNILLNKYNIETKYPKLAKLIQLRQKFQKYYLNFYIILILLVVVTEVTFALALLLI